MSKKRILRARLDGIDCVALRVFLSKEKLDLLRAAHYSEIYFKSGCFPMNEWVGASVIERRHLAVFIYRNREMDDVGDLMFFAKMPDLRLESRHPEWGEPSGRHYVVPLSFPVSKVVIFAEELEHDDTSD